MSQQRAVCVLGALGEILRERLAAGVQVFILYDAVGTVDIPASELEAFRAAGANMNFEIDRWR